MRRMAVQQMTRNEQLLELRSNGHTYKAIGTAFGISGNRVRQIVLQETRYRRASPVPAWCAGLPCRIIHALKAEVPDLDKAAVLEKLDIHAFYNIGKKSSAMIREAAK